MKISNKNGEHEKMMIVYFLFVLTSEIKHHHFGRFDDVYDIRQLKYDSLRLSINWMSPRTIHEDFK